MIAHLPLRLDAVVVFLIIELARLSGARVGCGTAVVLGDGLLVVDDLREVGCGAGEQQRAERRFSVPSLSPLSASWTLSRQPAQ